MYLEFLDERPSADIVDCSINTVLPVSFCRHIKIPTLENTSRPACRAECSRYTYTSIQMHACIYKHTQYTHKHKNNLSHKHTHKYVHACINIKENLQKKRKYRYLTNCSQVVGLKVYGTPYYVIIYASCVRHYIFLSCTPFYEMFYASFTSPCNGMLGLWLKPCLNLPLRLLCFLAPRSYFRACKYKTT